MENQSKTYYAMKFVVYAKGKETPIVFYTPKVADESKLAKIEFDFYDAWENEVWFSTQMEENDVIGWMRLNMNEVVFGATSIESYTY